MHGGNFCVVPGARASVHWNRGNFLSFWIRSFRMGMGLRELHRRWNIHEETFWRKPDELNGPFAMLDLIRYFAVTLGFIFARKVETKPLIPTSGLRIKWNSDEELFVLDPAVRILSAPEFTVYKDTIRMRKIMTAGRTEGISPLTLLQRDREELLRSGFLYSSVSRSATRHTS